jgi:hypothetical protein
MTKQTGGCHCGRVRFEVDGTPHEVVSATAHLLAQGYPLDRAPGVPALAGATS